MKKIYFLLLFSILMFGCRKANADTTAAAINDSLRKAQEQLIGELVSNDEAIVESYDPELLIILSSVASELRESGTFYETPSFVPNDTIAIGDAGPDGTLPALHGNLEIGAKWLCISFPTDDHYGTRNVCTTQSHSTNYIDDEVTLLSRTSGDEYTDCDIAFRDCESSDIKMFSTRKIRIESDTAKSIMRKVKAMLPTKRLKEWNEVAGDSIVLERIEKMDIASRKITILTFKSTNPNTWEMSSSAQLVIEDDKIRYAASGDRCNVNFFRLKGRNLMLAESTPFCRIFLKMYDVQRGLDKPIYKNSRHTH